MGLKESMVGKWGSGGRGVWHGFWKSCNHLDSKVAVTPVVLEFFRFNKSIL